jgi:hypothetical protein
MSYLQLVADAPRYTAARPSESGSADATCVAPRTQSAAGRQASAKVCADIPEARAAKYPDLSLFANARLHDTQARPVP